MTGEPLHTRTRDIIVIGCSAGGIEALPRIVQQLPHDLRATVFIVQHMSPTNTPYLVDILQRNSQLSIDWAEQGARFERAHIYVCPPDVHLLFEGDYINLSRTARENHSRPSIDKMFRSAAAAFGARVIGTLLTGMLDDGVAGLVAIRAAGGVVVVQDPEDAQFPELPSRALLALEPDRCLPIDAIPSSLLAMIEENVAITAIPEDVAIEANMDLTGPSTPARMKDLGPQVSLSCPECKGPMWELGNERTRRYRCYLGHVASAREMIIDSTVEIEAALWSAVRALNDRATTLEMLANDALKIGNGTSSESYAVRAREAREQAELARKFMLDLGRPPKAPDPPG